MKKETSQQNATCCTLSFLSPNSYDAKGSIVPLVKRIELKGHINLKPALFDAARELANFFKRKPAIGVISGIELHTMGAVYAIPEISVAALKGMTTGAIADKFVLSRRKAA
ncbi:MAG: hypothetical protein HGB08_02070 [Candidatus Moranbacteria bacterium]|nr:hypothetical protein [Candidatus Moranbacteria bacterium]